MNLDILIKVSLKRTFWSICWWMWLIMAIQPKQSKH